MLEKNVYFEGDFLTVFEALNGVLKAISWEGEAYISVARKLFYNFNLVSIEWIPRSIKQVANHVCRLVSWIHLVIIYVDSVYP